MNPKDKALGLLCHPVSAIRDVYKWIITHDPPRCEVILIISSFHKVTKCDCTVVYPLVQKGAALIAHSKANLHIYRNFLGVRVYFPQLI